MPCHNAAKMPRDDDDDEAATAAAVNDATRTTEYVEFVTATDRIIMSSCVSTSYSHCLCLARSLGLSVIIPG